MELYKLVGSVKIIGGPVHLISSITSGVTEFFQRPAEAVREEHNVKAGVAHGTKLLVEQTRKGMFNTTSKLGKNLASLRDRERRRRRRSVVPFTRCDFD